MSTKGKKFSIETRKKMSIAHKGLLLGKKLTLEHRKKLSEAKILSGTIPPSRKGIKNSEETRRKISIANSGERNYRWKGGYKNKLWHNRQRKFRKKTAVGTHTFEQWEELKKYFNFMCLCCKQQEPFIKLTEDHIIPLSVGGSNDISNIQPLCQKCNSLKWTKIIDFRTQALAGQAQPQVLAGKQ